jgi:hypothetical protein
MDTSRVAFVHQGEYGLLAQQTRTACLLTKQGTLPLPIKGKVKQVM